MQLRRVKRVIDALGGQDRVILHLSCGHNLSFFRRELVADPGLHHALEGLHPGESSWMCRNCPDPTPEDDQQTKSATQLWREAGEP